MAMPRCVALLSCLLTLLVGGTRARSVDTETDTRTTTTDKPGDTHHSSLEPADFVAMVSKLKETGNPRSRLLASIYGTLNAPEIHLGKQQDGIELKGGADSFQQLMSKGLSKDTIPTPERASGQSPELYGPFQSPATHGFKHTLDFEPFENLAEQSEHTYLASSKGTEPFKQLPDEPDYSELFSHENIDHNSAWDTRFGVGSEHQDSVAHFPSYDLGNQVGRPQQHHSFDNAFEDNISWPHKPVSFDNARNIEPAEGVFEGNDISTSSTSDYFDVNQGHSMEPFQPVIDAETYFLNREEHSSPNLEDADLLSNPLPPLPGTSHGGTVSEKINVQPFPGHSMDSREQTTRPREDNQDLFTDLFAEQRTDIEHEGVNQEDILPVFSLPGNSPEIVLETSKLPTMSHTDSSTIPGANAGEIEPERPAFLAPPRPWATDDTQPIIATRPHPKGVVVTVDRPEDGSQVTQEVAIEPDMSVFNGLYAASVKLSLTHPFSSPLDFFAAPDPELGCYVIAGNAGYFANSTHVWEISVFDQYKQIISSGPCIPPSKELRLQPGFRVSLAYVSRNQQTTQSDSDINLDISAH